MNKEEPWVRKYETILEYMERFRRRPSKHRVEDHLMLNWMKYNKKMAAAGKLSEGLRARFAHLLSIADKYQKLNQYSYVRPASVEGEVPDSR